MVSHFLRSSNSATSVKKNVKSKFQSFFIEINVLIMLVTKQASLARSQVFCAQDI